MIISGNFDKLVQVSREEIQDLEFVSFPGHRMGLPVISSRNDPEGGQFRICFGEKGS